MSFDQIAILRDYAGNPIGVKSFLFSSGSYAGPYSDIDYSTTDFAIITYYYYAYYYMGFGLCIENISEVKQARTPILEVPAANFDIIQNLKLKNRQFRIKGTILINMELGKQELRSIITQTGSLQTDKIPATPIFYANVSFRDVGGRPSETEFDLEAVEIKY